MTFIPDEPRIRMRPVAALSRDDELRTYVAARMARLDDVLRTNELPLVPRATYASWSRCMDGAFYRPPSIQAWRDERNARAIIDALTLKVSARDSSRSARGIVWMREGQSRDALLRAVVEARRIARRYRRAFIRSAYGGTVTRDGLSYGVIHSRLQSLDRAIALSDTFIAHVGDEYAIPRLARGLRHDDGTLDGYSNLAVARARARRVGGS